MQSVKIPTKFNLFGKTITVKMDQTLSYDADYCGVAKYRINEIRLQPNVKGIAIPQTTVEQTFYHELVHFILDAMRKNDMSNDEQFVDVFAALLHQAMQTAEYEEGPQG